MRRPRDLGRRQPQLNTHDDVAARLGVMTSVPVLTAELVDRSADPPRARAGLTRLARVHSDLSDRLASDERLEVALVTVLAASRSLTELLATDQRALEVLAAPEHRPSAPLDLEEIVGWSQRELLRIASLDLTAAQPLAATTSALSAMARDVLAVAHDLAAGDLRLGIIGMGKLGGNELNYASDVDILLVGEGDPGDLERAGRTFLDLAGRCF